jgi:hypothetical protein
MQTINKLKYKSYNKFWQQNAESIDKISQKLEKEIIAFEKESQSVNSFLNSIEISLDSLCSIYSAFNTIAGRDYILKLKAVISKQKRLLTNGHNKFDTIFYLLDRINKLKKESLQAFPALKHDHTNIDNKALFIKPDSNKTSIINKKSFKWITFKRNGSWFITPYKDKFHIKANQTNQVSQNSSAEKKVFYRRKKYTVIDLFSISYKTHYTEPEIYLNIDNSEYFYSIDMFGKTFMANNNFVKKSIHRFKKRSTISQGYVRFAGQRYIYLENQHAILNQPVLS